MKVVQPTALRRKGWNEREIAKAERIVNVPQPHDSHFSRIVFWSALIVIIFANLVVSLVLIPFFIIFHAWMLYSIIILLAGSIGFLYNLLITDIGHLQRKHHVWAGIIVPIIAAANMIIMVLVANQFIAETHTQTATQSPWLIAAVFSGVLILPYLFGLLRKR